ncbi:MAG: hypothetical protein KKE16_00965 [Firmicutes bacterium]|nr:hypothetical protein [Bacillota bacterium]
MKKLLLIFTLLLSAVVLLGCNTGGSDLDIDYTEIAGTPMNLVITNKILSWDDVPEADKYIIFVNGTQQATVSSNSYDFSSLTGTVLVFQVQTDGKRGYQNSGLSASIAYVSNRTTEISSVQTLAEDAFGDVPDGFAAALVDKGMVASEFESMSTDMTTFVDSVNSAEGDIIAISEALQVLIATDINFEALINAFLLYVPGLVNQNIESIQESVDMYEYYIEEYGDYGGYYQSQIDEYNSQIMMYEELESAIETSHEDVLLSALHTTQYFVSILTQLDTAFFTNIDNLINADNPSDLETSEIILVKEELSQAMLDNMPSIQDMVVMFELITAMSISASGDTTMISYPTENAAQSLLCIEAFARLLDTIDAEFIDSLKGFYAEDPDTYEVETMILAIKYFNTFQIENDGLIEEMREVLTYDQQKALFDDYLSAVSGVSGSEVAISDSFVELFEFGDVYALTQFGYDLMDPVLEWFDYTDGEILRLIYMQSEYDLIENYTLSQYNQTLNQVEIMEYMSQLLALITGEADDNVANALSGILVSALLLGEDSAFDTSGLTDSEIEALFGDVRNNVESEMDTLITLMTVFFGSANSEGLFTDLYNLEVELHDYAVVEYGANYYEVSAYFSDDTSDYAHAIVLAGFLSEFLNSTNRGRVEDVLNMVFNTMMLPEILEMTGMSTEEVQLVQSGFFDDFDFLVSQSAKIKNYDPFDLSSAEEDEVESFLYLLG